MKKTEQPQAPKAIPAAQPKVEGENELGIPQALMKEATQEAIQLKLQKAPASLAVTDPFSKRVDLNDVFKHQQVNELQGIIRAAIAQCSMVLVSGPPGVGKTTGVRCVTDELQPNKFNVVYLGQDQHGVNLLSRFSEVLGLPTKRFRQHLVLQLGQWLSGNVADGGKSVILIVDEAHLLDDQTLEELRLLSNADFDRQSSFTLIMIAQPWLRARLKSPFFEPLSQRIRYRYSLEGLSKEDTFNYVRGRLLTAGLSPTVFSDEALQQIFAYSEGIPRKVNNLCSHLMLKVQSLDLLEINAGLVKQVIDSQDI
jgi:type II secretory pathway predicted ATPase ExeA